MKQGQKRENNISGWANQNQFNQDAIVLTNILQRKSKTKPLPYLNNHKNKQQKQKHKQLSNSRLGFTLNKFYHKSNELIKAQTDKTEINQHDQDNCNILQKPKRFVAITQQANQPPSLSPFLNNRKYTEKIKPSQPTHQEDNMSPFYKYQKCNHQNFFSKTMKLNKFNTKSHQFIIHKVSNKVDKIETKLSLKPNNFQLGRIKFRNKSKKNIEQKICLSEQRQLMTNKNKRNYSRIDMNSKKNSKYQNILAKRQILANMSSKDQAEFSDQIIFSNNSIVVNKQFLNNPYLQSKIQIIKQPQRYPQMFNK